MKKVLCVFIAMCMLVESTPVYAETNNSRNIEETIYVDGIEVKIKQDVETGNIIAQAETGNNKGEMILETDGEGVVEIDNLNQTDKFYELDIENLSTENVDVDVYEDGKIIDEYDSYEDIVEDEYEGQTTLTWELVVTGAILLTAVILSAQVIYRSRVMFVLAENFYRAVTYSVAKVRTKAQKQYYKAYISAARNVVYICPKAISLLQASRIITSGNNVYSFNTGLAQKVIRYSGYVPCNSNGQRMSEIHIKKRKTVYYHWHCGITNAKGNIRKIGNAHSLYGRGVYRT